VADPTIHPNHKPFYPKTTLHAYAADGPNAAAVTTPLTGAVLLPATPLTSATDAARAPHQRSHLRAILHVAVVQVAFLQDTVFQESAALLVLRTTPSPTQLHGVLLLQSEGPDPCTRKGI
jgi:hypothetical protein